MLGIFWIHVRFIVPKRTLGLMDQDQCRREEVPAWLNSTTRYTWLEVGMEVNLYLLWKSMIQRRILGPMVQNLQLQDRI
uniref:Putative secreted protein n=1 Tax=Panstrongylus lignarius TaxID=156445 RepID=A0A224Y3H2_9HEMI